MCSCRLLVEPSKAATKRQRWPFHAAGHPAALACCKGAASAQVHAIALTQDGSMLAVATQSGIRVWEACVAGRCMGALRGGHTKAVGVLLAHSGGGLFSG